MIRFISNLFGYELIRKKKSPSLESHLQNILKRLEINLVLDVGANNGQFGTMLRNIGYQGEILSFEPVSKAFKVLNEASSHDNKWTPIKLGLSDKKEFAEINIFSASDFNSLLKPSLIGKDSFQQKLNQSDTELIELDTLDNFLSNICLEKKNILLKIDTQGHDLNVFNGAKKSAPKFLALLSELSFQPIYENMPDYHEVLKIYEASGFIVSGLYPISRNKNGCIIEMDCVMLKNKYTPPSY